MKNEDIVWLVPGISKVKLGAAAAHKYRVTEVLKAMAEQVTIIKLSNGSGNSKVRDRKGVVFYCSTEDLKPMYKDHFAV